MLDHHGKVSKVRRLLQEAAAPVASTALLRSGPIGTIKRKCLISDARLLAARYSLQAHLEAFVHCAGHEAITGLDVERLELLVAKLTAMGAALDAGCDSGATPPAR